MLVFSSWSLGVQLSLSLGTSCWAQGGWEQLTGTGVPVTFGEVAVSLQGSGAAG